MKTRMCLVILLVALLASTAVWADMTPLFSSATVAPGGDVWSGFSITIPKFDPTLGTLTGVDFTMFTTNGFTGAFLANSFGGPYTGTVASTSTLTLLDGSTYTLNPGATTGLVTTGGGTAGPLNGSASSSNAVDLPEGALLAYLAPYIGTGTTSWGIASVDNGSGWSPAPGSGSTFPVFSSDRVTMQYDYIPTADIPEPSSLALLGIGLPMLGLWRKRRGKK